MKRFFLFLTVVFLLWFPAVSLAQLQTSNTNVTDGKPTLIGGTSIFFLKSLGYETEAFTREGIIFSPFATLILIIFSFLGIVFLSLAVYGGVLWMASSGSDEKVEKAKNILRDAILGLLVILSSYFITYFIVNFGAVVSLAQEGVDICATSQLPDWAKWILPVCW